MKLCECVNRFITPRKVFDKLSSKKLVHDIKDHLERYPAVHRILKVRSGKKVDVKDLIDVIEACHFGMDEDTEFIFDSKLCSECKDYEVRVEFILYEVLYDI